MALSPGSRASCSGVKTSLTRPMPRCSVELLTVAGDDARALLPAVLQRMQPQVGQVRGLGVAEDAEYSTHGCLRPAFAPKRPLAQRRNGRRTRSRSRTCGAIVEKQYSLRAHGGYPPARMGALDELLTAWRSNPDAESTVAICSYSWVSGPEALIREVGTSAEAWHVHDPAVMLAVGRMYLDAGLLVEGQAALVLAGKANSRDPRPFRYLGEVLLRRGDAMRAEKVLARALQLGSDAEARLWHDRAVVYVALQKRIGGAGGGHGGRPHAAEADVDPAAGPCDPTRASRRTRKRR